MFRLEKTKQIDASHQLPHHDGKCRRLHGHTYSITLCVEGESLNNEGPKQDMLFDYYDLGVIMKEHVERLDHRHLNDYWDNPTSEVIACALFKKIAPLIKKKSDHMARLVFVKVAETPSTVATYWEGALL